jgi:GT2 family glycosyltransferase
VSSRPSVAVVVPTYRRPHSLERCLRAIGAQSVAPDRVVVVVRDGDAESEQTVERVQPDVRCERVVVHEPGHVAAIAAGLSRCVEDVVAHTDDDAAPHPDWLERLLAHYGPGVGGVGGRDVLQPPRPRARSAPTVGRVAWFGRLEGNHHEGVGAPRRVDVLKTVNMSLRRELWQLDPRLRGGGAQIHMEVDVCLRAARDGWRLVYDPQAQVDHYPAQRFDEDDRDRPTLGARANVEFNYAYALAKHLPAWRLVPAAVYLFGFGTRYAPGVAAWAELVVRHPRQLLFATRLFAAVTRARAQGLAAGIRRRAE